MIKNRYTPLYKWTSYSIENKRYWCRNKSECGNISKKPFTYYCSKECQQKILKDAYAHDFFRNAVLRKYNNTCQLCGYKGNIEAHHKVPVSDGGSYDIDNGIALCQECHKKQHSKESNKIHKDQIALDSFIEVG